MSDLQANVTERITATVEAILAESDTPGASVAISVDGTLVCAHGIGFSDRDGSEVLQRDAQFSIYSVTKTILAIALMRLVESGRISLEETIQAILPEVPIDRSITLRQLLNHTSGLPDYSTLPEYSRDLRRDPGTPWTDDEFLERTMRQGYLFPPGEGWAYSNIGYLLVRRTVERITGQRLAVALADLVFEPLGLGTTTVITSLADTRRLTPAYSRQLDEAGDAVEMSRRYHPGWVSHGVVCSTAEETAGVLGALTSHTLLQPRTVSVMYGAVAVPASHPLFRTPAYGLGLMIDLDAPYGLVVGHTGGGPGYSAAAYHFPDVKGRNVTVGALANGDVGDPATRVTFAIVKQLEQTW